jgi:hypothetical protein
VLEAGRVRGLEPEERGHERGRPRTQQCGRRKRGESECHCEADSGAGGQLAARDRPQAFDRMIAVVDGVAHVVDEVGGARRSAVRAEGGDRLAPARGIPDLRGEDDAGEQEQVLRPLARAQRGERGARKRSRRLQSDNRHE